MHSNSVTASCRAFFKKTNVTTAAVVALPLTQLVAMEVDWIKLFEGKTFDGWHKNPKRIGHGTGGRLIVEGGTIVGEQPPRGSGNRGILLSDRNFGDFEVEVDMNHD